MHVYAYIHVTHAYTCVYACTHIRIHIRDMHVLSIDYQTGLYTYTSTYTCLTTKTRASPDQGLYTYTSKYASQVYTRIHLNMRRRSIRVYIYICVAGLYTYTSTYTGLTTKTGALSGSQWTRRAYHVYIYMHMHMYYVYMYTYIDLA